MPIILPVLAICPRKGQIENKIRNSHYIPLLIFSEKSPLLSFQILLQAFG